MDKLIEDDKLLPLLIRADAMVKYSLPNEDAVENKLKIAELVIRIAEYIAKHRAFETKWDLKFKDIIRRDKERAAKGIAERREGDMQAQALQE